MPQATQAALDARVELDEALPVRVRRVPVAARNDVRLAIHEGLDEVEQEWRAFEQIADCTVFQSFDWVATWQRNIGSRTGVTPVIVTGRDILGQLLFLLPLAIKTTGIVRRLTWLGADLSDYNTPMLAMDFPRAVGPARFMQLWHEIALRLQTHPRLQYDLVDLEKMPDTVGAQPNPLLRLAVIRNPNGAYLAHLSGDWDAFYAAKRSGSTRKRDRYRRKRLADHGQVQVQNPEAAVDVVHAVDALMEQKARSFSRMGVADVFAPPGRREFFRVLATDPRSRHLVHVSHLDVDAAIMAVNFGLAFRGRYYHLLASHDDGELSRFGAGTVHLQDLLRRANELGFREFDFTIGDEPYKREWCDTEIALFDHVASVTLRGWPVAMRLLAVRRLKRWIKQTPVLWNAAYKLRTLVGPLMTRLRG